MFGQGRLLPSISVPSVHFRHAASAPSVRASFLMHGRSRTEATEVPIGTLPLLPSDPPRLWASV